MPSTDNAPVHRSMVNKFHRRGSETRKPDRRVSRTRRALHEALRSLILEKGYEQVTVQDILDRADVGRATFYSHFHDKDDLLKNGFEEMRQSLRRQLSHSGQGLGFARLLFEHAAGHRREYQAKVGRSSAGGTLDIMVTELTSILRHQVGDTHRRSRAPAPVPADVLIKYLVGALMALLTWWLDENPPYTAEQMAQMFEQATLPAMTAALGGP